MEVTSTEWGTNEGSSGGGSVAGESRDVRLAARAARPTILIILNPTAAKGKAKKAVPSITRIFSSFSSSDTFEIVQTVHAWHAAELAEQAAVDGVRIVVAAGGDGTILEVVNGLMAAKQVLPAYASLPALGIIPIGRGNDFAFVAGIPRNLQDACELIVMGGRSTFDIAKVIGGDFPEGRYFTNGVGIGFEPMVNHLASKFKRLSGVPSYIIALIKLLRHYPEALPMDLIINGTPRHIRSQQMSICNGKRMGGSFLLGPDADIHDGALNLSYIDGPVSGLKILHLVLLFFQGKQRQDPIVRMELIHDIEIQAGVPGIVCHADGEMVSLGTDRVSIHLYPGALEMICETRR